MVPRSRMVTAPRSTSVADLEALVAESGHSRIPVTGRTLDDVVGFVHSKDLLRFAAADREIPVPLEMVRRMVIVTPDQPVRDLMRSMRRASSRRLFAPTTAGCSAWSRSKTCSRHSSVTSPTRPMAAATSLRRRRSAPSGPVAPRRPRPPWRGSRRRHGSSAGGAGNQSDSSATVDLATAEESSTSQPSGARSSHVLELGEAGDRLGGHCLDRAGSDEVTNALGASCGPGSGWPIPVRLWRSPSSCTPARRPWRRNPAPRSSRRWSSAAQRLRRAS